MLYIDMPYIDMLIYSGPEYFVRGLNCPSSMHSAGKDNVVAYA